MKNSEKGVQVYLGESFFKNGDPIYINKVVEEPAPHVHSHDFIEIAYVASGEGTHKINDKEYDVKKGDLFIINYDTPHGFRSPEDQARPRLVIYNCVFKPEFFDYRLISAKDFQNMTHHYLFRSLFPDEVQMPGDIALIGKQDDEIGQLYEKMYREYCTRETGYVELLRAYVIELLVLIARNFKNVREADSVLNVHRQQMIEKAMKYMMENYNKDIRLEELSMMSFFSRNYFCRLFKETTGMTAFEYIQKLRIQDACTMLGDKSRRITEIAGLVGYKDIKFFNEVFRRYTGVSPSEFRRRPIFKNSG